VLVVFAAIATGAIDQIITVLPFLFMLGKGLAKGMLVGCWIFGTVQIGYNNYVILTKFVQVPGRWTDVTNKLLYIILSFLAWATLSPTLAAFMGIPSVNTNAAGLYVLSGLLGAALQLLGQGIQLRPPHRK